MRAPQLSRKIHFQIKPATVAGIAQGRSIPTRSAVFPQNGSLSRSATRTPRTSSAGTLTTANQMVVRAASAK
ncbi:MAG: hypothetical protein C4346_13630 [Chloroflexota bacterium]